MAVLPRIAFAGVLVPLSLLVVGTSLAFTLTGCAKALTEPSDAVGVSHSARSDKANGSIHRVARGRFNRGAGSSGSPASAGLNGPGNFGGPSSTELGALTVSPARVRAPVFAFGSGAFGSGAFGSGAFGSGDSLGAMAGMAVEDLLPEGARPLDKNGLCPPDMASVDDLYCIDRYEASLVELTEDGLELAWPHYLPVEGHVVRAVSEKGVKPQGYISEKQAIDACGRSGKRLCKPSEWRKACKGPENLRYGYANEDESKRCNNYGLSPVTRFWGSSSGDLSVQANWDNRRMNAPELNQMPQTLSNTGDHEGCTNGYGVYDMVGNIHEWVDDPEGTFQGGYFQDTKLNGEGCGYRTDAHAAWYHDYSTGFRCCGDVAQ